MPIFPFTFHRKFHPCALVHWYFHVGDDPDDDTGMWIVKAEEGAGDAPSVAVLHLDTIVHAAHLIGIYGEDFLSSGLIPEQSLCLFYAYYFIYHHSFAIAF